MNKYNALHCTIHRYVLYALAVLYLELVQRFCLHFVLQVSFCIS